MKKPDQKPREGKADSAEAIRENIGSVSLAGAFASMRPMTKTFGARTGRLASYKATRKAFAMALHFHIHSRNYLDGLLFIHISLRMTRTTVVLMIWIPVSDRRILPNLLP